MFNLVDVLAVPPEPIHEHQRTAKELKALKGVINKLNFEREVEMDGKDHDDHDEPDGDQFDHNEGARLMEDPLRILKSDGKVVRLSSNSLVQRRRLKRHLFLCNDVLIVTKPYGGGMLKGPEGFSVKQLIWLEKVRLAQNFGESDRGSAINDPNTFELLYQGVAGERSYTFTCESLSQKKVWIQSISAQVLACRSRVRRITAVPGWHLDAVMGSIWSDALRGEIEAVERHLTLTPELLDEPDAYGMTPLHWASLRGHHRVVACLLREGASVHSMNNGLNTPLLCAAAGGHDNVFRRLLSSGSDISQRNLSDMDALFMVALFSYSSDTFRDTLRTLEEAGVDFNMQDSSGRGVLHHCTERGTPEWAIQALVNHGAEINRRSAGGDGLTPLAYLCSGTEIPPAERVRYLMGCGASPNVRCPDTGRTCIQLILATLKNDPDGLRRKSVDFMDAETRQSMCTPVMHWTLHALPVLLELCKSGARLMPGDTDGLRESFKEAILTAVNHWNRISPGPDYKSFLVSSGAGLTCPSSKWVPDAKHSLCPMCDVEFTFQIRKHHCRTCGHVCCNECSMKRLSLVRGGKEERVCDGCFNRLIVSAEQRARKLREAAPKKAATSASMLSGSDRATAASTTMSEAGQALIERGEKLQEAADKSERLQDDAAEFASAATELKRREKERAERGLGFKNVFGM